MKLLGEAQAREIVRRFPGVPVMVYGDLILDRYVWGSVERISPEAPVPVLRVHEITDRPGGAANVAANLAALGAEARPVGVVGTDEEAGALLRTLEAAHIGTEGILADPARPTTVKTRYIAQQQQMLRTDRESHEPPVAAVEKRIVAALGQAAREARGAIVSDYRKGTVTEAGLKVLRAKQLPFFVDPKGRDYATFRGAAVLTPNQTEAASASGIEIRGEADLLEAAARLRQSVDGAPILVTRGERGMALFEGSGPPVYIPAIRREVFDVTGAGDTVLAVLALASLSGATLAEAAALATAAASVVIGRVGTSTLTPDDLLQGIEDYLALT